MQSNRCRCVSNLSGRRELRSVNRLQPDHKATFIKLLLKFLLIAHTANIPAQCTIDALRLWSVFPHLDQESHLCMAEI